MFSDDDPMNESRVRRRIAADVLPSAIERLKKIIEADGTKDADRISAIKIAIAHTIGPVTSGALGKPAEEMTAAEISARITELRARQAIYAEGAKLIEGAPIDAPPAAGGICE